MKSLLLAILCVTGAAHSLPAVAEVDISTDQSRSAIRSIDKDRHIDLIVSSIARDAVGHFKTEGITRDDIAVAVILDKENSPSRFGGYNLQKDFYPASVCKIAYAVALERDFASGKLPRDEETLDDLRRMLVFSSNTTTNNILDRLTGTVSGERMSEEELQVFGEKRNEVNRYMRQLGFTSMNVNQKTWDRTIAPSDMQFRGPNGENRNRMNVEETAKLVWLIAHKKVVSESACDEILKYMHRKSNNPKDIQSTAIGSGLPVSAKQWSKAGWTDEVTHDAGYVDLMGDEDFTLVVFTNATVKDRAVIGWIAGQVVSAIQLERFEPLNSNQFPKRVGGTRGAN